MWMLMIGSLRYRAAAALYAAGIALVLAAAANLILPLVGAAPSPDDDFKLVYLFPILLLFSSAFVGFGQIVGDTREVRLATYAILPRTKTELGLAWVLTPCILPFMISTAISSILIRVSSMF